MMLCFVQTGKAVTAKRPAAAVPCAKRRASGMLMSTRCQKLERVKRAEENQKEGQSSELWVGLRFSMKIYEGGCDESQSVVKSGTSIPLGSAPAEFTPRKIDHNHYGKIHEDDSVCSELGFVVRLLKSEPADLLSEKLRCLESSALSSAGMQSK